MLDRWLRLETPFFTEASDFLKRSHVSLKFLFESQIRQLNFFLTLMKTPPLKIIALYIRTRARIHTLIRACGVCVFRAEMYACIYKQLRVSSVICL